MNALLRQTPNILSALRLIAAPIAAVLILDGVDFVAVCVFVAAGLSDALDGYLARRFALTSRFGAWLDPVADKLLMLASFVTLTIVGAVPLWLTIVVIGRDVAIVLGVGLARLLDAPLRIAPLMIGKASTVVQVVFVALVLLGLSVGLSAPRLEFAGCVVVALLTLSSFFAYAYVWLQALAAGRRAA